MEPWPAFCCAIVRDHAGRYLLERRPPRGPGEPRLLNCFGGTRERDEPPDACIRRELREELGFTSAFIEALGLERVLILRSARREIAWFYRARAIGADTPMVFEPGYEGVWLSEGDIAGAPLSGWHRAVFDALSAGASVAVVEE